ncbi:MAG: helix-turn-helix domain-containing protein [Nitrospirales bacterium]
MRTRSYRQLSAEERGTLSLGLAHGHSLRALARLLGRAPSTLSREVARNGDEGPTVSSLHGADPDGCQSPSASAPPETPGPLAAAVCPKPP